MAAVDLTVANAAEQLAKLRRAAGDVAPNELDDEDLLRFLIARGYGAHPRSHVAWRSDLTRGRAGFTSARGCVWCGRPTSGHRGNVDKASKMVTASLAWRDKMKVNELPLYPDGPSTFAVRGFEYLMPDVNNAVDDRTWPRAVYSDAAVRDRSGALM